MQQALTPCFHKMILVVAIANHCCKHACWQVQLFCSAGCHDGLQTVSCKVKPSLSECTDLTSPAASLKQLHSARMKHSGPVCVNLHFIFIKKASSGCPGSRRCNSPGGCGGCQHIRAAVCRGVWRLQTPRSSRSLEWPHGILLIWDCRHCSTLCTAAARPQKGGLLCLRQMDEGPHS